jgi:TRAP-type C4-dicarboxylate transport system substrate-binding protein
MKQFRILAASSTIAIGLAIPAAAQVELIYNSYLPPFNETYQVGIRDFAAAIAEESGGEIVVTIPDSSLAPSERQYEMVRDGIADMAVLQTEAVSQFVVLNELGGLPGMAPGAEAGSVALWETYVEHFREINELPGVVILSTHVLPGRDILTLGDLRIETPEDLRGQRIWASAHPFLMASEAMESVPLVLEFGEIQEFSARGDLDALFITAGSAESAGVLDMVGQIARKPGGFGSQSFMIIIAENRWNEMTDDQRAAILRAADGLPRRLGAANDASELEVAAQVEAMGVTVFEGEALAAFEAVVAPQIDDWKVRAAEAGLADPQAAIDFYMGVIARESGN